MNYYLLDNNIIMNNRLDDDRLECNCWKRFERYEGMNKLVPMCKDCKNICSSEAEIAEAADIINWLTEKHFWIHLVTCWQCWEIFSHKSWQEWDLTCPYCKNESEQCWFPDLFY